MEATKELAELQVLLTGIGPDDNKTDSFIWPYDISKYFTVRPCYDNLNFSLGTEALGDGLKVGMSIIWVGGGGAMSLPN